MDARTRDKYSTFLEEDWARLGYLDPPGSQEYGLGLTLPKLAIFHHKHHSRPIVGHVIWSQYSDTQYEKLCAELDPALRLASAMLQSPASLDLVYKIIYGPRRFPRERMDYEGQPVFEIEYIETNETRRNMARKALNRLAESLSFIAENHKEDGKKNCDAVVSHSLALHSYGINIADDSGTPRGIASIIRLNRNHLSKLTILLGQDGDNTSQILTLQFKLAVSICHNIVHAIGHAADLTLLLDAIMESTYRDLATLENTERSKERVGSNEPFLENESVAELGYSWENAVLGGTVQWANQVDHPLFFSKWPSFLTDGDYPRRAAYGRTTTQYVVPLHYLRNIHRQEFWDNVKAGDTTALHIQGLVGILVTNPDADTENLCTEPDSRENEKHNEGPDSFRVVGNTARDPSGSRANETLAERMQRISESKKSIRAGKLHIVNQINTEAVNARRRLQKVRKDRNPVGI